MTMQQYTNYLKEMEECDLLASIYNGWRYLVGKEELEKVSLDIVLADKAFIKWDKKAMEDEYRRGL